MKRTNEERKNRYINYLMMTGNAFKEILLHGLSNYLIDKYKIRAEQIIKDDNVMQRKIVLLSLVSDFIDGIITGSIFLYVINLAINNFILIGSVTAYLECIENIKLGMQEIFDGIGNSIEQSLYINFIFDFFEMPENTNTGNIYLEHIDSIKVENLSFKYRNKYVLKNVNLTINKGDSIVLIGENGSGKSTLIKLIMGFYSDYEGTIKINGIDLKNINKENYYKKIGCVFQDYTKYEASVRENVGFGDVGRINDSKKIKESLNTSFMLKKIEEIGGLDTIVGKWFGDKDFSTGEWQRIAISRAFFKDPDVYIFDEADASLDILKQEKLFKIYNRKIQNKTKIYITHKIDYAKWLATKFYILEEGCIVESGTHESLIEKQGRYYSMYNVYNSMKERRN